MPTLEHIRQATSNVMGPSVEDIIGQDRDRFTLQARRLAAFMMRQLTDAEYEEIGDALGGRKGPAIAKAIATIQPAIQKNSDDIQDLVSAIIRVAALDVIPWWDDGNIDPAIRPLISVLNRIPGIETFESCEGHTTGRDTLVVWFQYDGDVPPWERQFLQDFQRRVEEDDRVCLGCFSVRLRREYHWDCVHDLKGPYWELLVMPRRDSPPEEVRTNNDIILPILVESLEVIAQEQHSANA